MAHGRLRLLLLSLVLLLCFSGITGAQSPTQWLCRLIPLPKQITITKTIVLPSQSINVHLRKNAGAVEKSAASELRRALYGDPDSFPTDIQFEILLGICDAQGQLNGKKVPGVEKLKDLPNADQAYWITPLSGASMAITALNENGIYYAVQTICQLLVDQNIELPITFPLIQVLDWPDLQERGEWGGSVLDDIDWLASYKMNLIERHATLKINSSGQGYAETDTAQIEHARLRALKIVPIITHLDQLDGSGIYSLYPDLRGKGPAALDSSQPNMCAPCASDPRFQKIVADWMTSLASQKGVNEICVWLSESAICCKCDKCSQETQSRLETRCIVEAWKKVQAAYPKFRVRILLTQGSYDTNDQVLAECPPEIGVTYYHGGLTYDSSRNPMIYPLLEQYASQGRWLGCYPQLTASWRIVCPWTAPQFVQSRMQEFVDKKLRAVCGYATPDNRLYEFNILAAAEWAWNAHGRSPEEFALAWATRRHTANAEWAAKWAVMLGPVGWDVYGSGIPYPHFFGNAAALISERKAPVLGAEMFRYFPELSVFEKDLTVCTEALKIAQDLQEAEFVGETKSIQGFLGMLRALYDIANAGQGTSPLDNGAKERLQDSFNTFVHSAYRTCEALQQWEGASNQRHCWRGRFCDTLNVIRQTTRNIGQILRSQGITDVSPDFFGYEAGTWVSEEFEGSQRILKTLDVTPYLQGPGTYIVEFLQGEEYNGLQTHCATLVDLSVDPPREIAIDRHEGQAEREKEATAYRVNLSEILPDHRYGIRVEITGVRSSTQPKNMRGCNGVILFRKELNASEPLPTGHLIQPAS